MIRDHDVPPGKDRCKHCGAFKPGPDSTCIVRDGVAAQMMPEPARRVPACDDVDVISRRIAELRAEQQEAWNAETELAKYAWLTEYANRDKRSD